VPRLRARRLPGAAVTAIAVAVSWLGAGALVLGLVWTASTLAPDPPPETPRESLPYAIGWSIASLAIVLTTVAGLFADGGRRRTMTALAGTLAVALAALVVVANALSD
jgi:hypothetical protein